MSVFMARGYKDDPFHRHVARSLANYFGEQRVEELETAVHESETDQKEKLLELLESDTITAWGAKSDKRHDRELFEQMSPGDRFIMRTGQPTIVRYIQEVDVILDETVPEDLRRRISDTIWTSDDYDLIWLSATPILEIELPEAKFEQLISEVKSNFEMSDWFPSQGRNFTRINDDVTNHFGGDEEFIDQLSKWNGHRREQGVLHYFLLNITETEIDVETEHQFDFKQTDTDLSNEIIDAENDARLIFHDEYDIIGTGRLGNIEGERRDDGIHKILNIIDWQPVVSMSLEDIYNDIAQIHENWEVDASEPPMDFLSNIERINTDPWTAVKSTLGNETTPSTNQSIHCSDPVSPTSPYYWVNQSNKEEIEGEYLQAEDDELWTHDLAKLEPGDVVFNYHDGEIIGYSRVEGVPFPVTVDGEHHCRVNIDLHRFDKPISLASILETLLSDEMRLDKCYPVSAGGINPKYLYNISAEAGDFILQKGDVTNDAVKGGARDRLNDRLSLPEIDFELPDGLYFHAGERSRLRRQINAALNSGKHIIFTGPPGTGKSRLAREVSEQARDLNPVDGYTFTTATAEWTTFDTIGGNVPEVGENNHERLVFDPRLFLRSFRNDDEQIHNKWLVIDELNRADIDKAFGQLFSVLSQDSVELPYERDERVCIDWVDEETPPNERLAIANSSDRFPVTPAWRLIATMNTFDKTSLYELSFAFMRRFSFVHVGVPDLTADDGVVIRDLLDPTGGKNYAAVWRSQNPELAEAIDQYHEAVAILWKRINDHRTIGPSIVLDIFQYISAFEGGDRNAPLSSAVVSLVYPQLEGMRESEYENLLDNLAADGQIEARGQGGTTSVSLPLDMSYLRSKAADMFDIDV